MCVNNKTIKTELYALVVWNTELLTWGKNPEITISASLDTKELTKSNPGMMFLTAALISGGTGS